MILKDINIRPVRVEDVAELDRLRRIYPEAFLELPHGLKGPGVETAVAEKGVKMIGSLTGINAVVMDPFIHNPDFSGPEVFAAVYMLERVLSYNAQVGGATDAYIAIPNSTPEYGRIVERSGYVKTCENCTIYRRPLIPDSVTLIENEVVDTQK